ncbi:ABC transporter ATP-binding protein [Mesorhizobium escarrei]|uniref:Maltose ABC transporter ATP binding subunit n=1 Tax=Mesorhizobium escarrei TaxID=666018 RepID=A0ABM9DVZ9_9HYPH|nr:sn-glycerol-3-phosphate ABC transporter ATP-binding protein UgpC [Mesorhizobium escarrei]CAH2400912.1 maltose ABC transporter ATP binding subunit [Mesorhizobium escarrei]
MSGVELKSVRKNYGAVEVIKGVDLTVRDREFVVFVGPSGCGKSTLLRMIAGLEEITVGDLLIDGARMNDVSPDARGLAMVFQSYALYPHMTVAGNMGFALMLAGVPKAERDLKVRQAAKILQLEALLDRKPGQLSGGQRQRVAIGRAIVREPKVFLFDEPLSNLDAALRVQMRVELAKLHRDLNATMIYVTHDQVEAMTMADRILVLRAGIVEQVGSPLDLYNKPANTFVAGFIGSPKMNLVGASVSRRDGQTFAFLDGGQRLPIGDVSLKDGAGITLGLRPEALLLSAGGAARGEVSVIEHLGGETLVYVDIGKGQLLTIKTGDQQPARVGDIVPISFDPSRLHLFGPDGQALN